MIINSTLTSFLFVTLFSISLIGSLANAAGSHLEPGPHWGYEGDIGPAKWGSLKQEFHSCVAGKRQSPIDLREKDGKKEDSLPPLKFSYFSSQIDILNNGHTIQLSYDKGSKLNVGNENYELLQFHFHTPSEHSLNGKRAEMEVHFVHKKEDGSLLVVGLLMKKGEKNKSLEEIFDNFPIKHDSNKKLDKKINGIDILPTDSGYYTYSGSLTTPPCSEIVTWYVLKNTIEVSGDQIKKFTKLFHMNARPIQKLDGRDVEVKE